MAFIETDALVKVRDKEGKEYLIYPITKTENVQGLDTYVGNIVDNSCSKIAQDVHEVETSLEETKTQLSETNNDLKTTKENLEATNQGLTNLGITVSESVEKLEKVSENLEKVSIASGYGSSETVFNGDGSITKTFANGTVVHSVFNSDGSITETTLVENEANNVKTTTFNSDGSISEVITV